ncbi:D-glycero-beta-D-manno-heptose-7-phosphate kinase [bacterium]|nr:D-glycero-beta-D-manno-heptose-7-phosphate kinase [bacterium]
MKLDISMLRDSIATFSDLRIAVLGDLMLDRFVRGQVERISPEAPVPVLLKESEDYYPGGAANVAMNVAALQGKTRQIGLVGCDWAADVLLKKLEEAGIETNGVIASVEATTTVKSRFVSMGQQLMRLDEEKAISFSDDIGVTTHSLLDGCDALLISDYSKGVIPLWAKGFVSDARSRGIKVIVDPKPPNWGFYSGCDVVTPNRKESLSTVPPAERELCSVEDIARSVTQIADAKQAVMTWGAEGIYTWDGHELQVIPSHRVRVYDPTGAGDSVIASLTLAIASGLDLSDAARIANAAGAAAVSIPGIARVTPEEIISVLESDFPLQAE